MGSSVNEWLHGCLNPGPWIDGWCTVNYISCSPVGIMVTRPQYQSLWPLGVMVRRVSIVEYLRKCYVGHVLGQFVAHVYTNGSCPEGPVVYMYTFG